MDLEGFSTLDAYPVEGTAGRMLDALHTDNATAQSTLHKTLTNTLKKFAPQESWFFAEADKILNQKLRPEVHNIYIDKLLLKTHDPNLIFENVRKLLAQNRFFAFRIDTAENIKFRILQKLPSVAFFFYYAPHFLFRRVLPKLKGFRKVCRLLDMPVDISKAEIIGRLIYKGFDIVDLVETDHETIIIAKTNSSTNPSESKPLPNEGFLFSMNRLGKHGKLIKVYKFRSMHPYAEYVQEYLHRVNGIDNGGKFRNDFRVSTGGRLIRKYWIDELPMLVNLVKGDIKLVGVRPLSEHYFGLYPTSAQQLRRNHKPGLLPPFYADLPSTFAEIIQSEINYLTQYEQHPITTDLKYLGRIVKNIVFHQARSK